MAELNAKEEWLARVHSSLASEKEQLMHQLVEETKVRGRQTRCFRGHEYAKHGRRDSNGYWWCKACARIRKRKKRSENS